MKDSNWQKVETIIDQVLDLPPEEREPFIEEQCKDDHALKGEVTQLLQSIFDSEGWLDHPEEYKKEFYDEISDDVESLPSGQSLVGKQVGAYKIKEQIGQGGMGSVYLAERSDEGFQHCVAIKIIRHGQATETNIRRFKREQQILADLNHPGIATLFDGGITDDGFLYIIMEYVDGIPLDEYCKQHECSIKQRIDIFEQILEAVRHAHENLVIHRDLKPGNILVDTSGCVKILDFGISKLVEEESDLSLTQTGMRLLTPKYAAPEQIRETNITTATDLYALGVIFYELLSGFPPFQFDNASRHEIERAILEEAPSNPSSKVTSRIQQKKLRGDLDAIALKAIRKEPDQRYRVANDFLTDLNNYKKGLPVTAREDSLQYRTKKFINRHSQGIAVTAGALLLIISFAGFYTWRITEERNQAQFEAKKAEQVIEYVKEIFRANDPSENKGDTLNAADLLSNGLDKVDQLRSQPEIQSELMTVLADVYTSIGNYEKADSLLHASLSIQQQLFGNSSPEAAQIYSYMGSLKNDMGNWQEAIAFHQRALDILQRESVQNPKLLAEKTGNIAMALEDKGDMEKARSMYEKALRLYENEHLTRSDSNRVLIISRNYGTLLAKQGKFNRAEELLRNAYTIVNKFYGENTLETARAANDLGALYMDQGKYDSAYPLFEKGLSIKKEILGDNHPKIAATYNNMAVLQERMEHFSVAESLYNKTLNLTYAVFGEKHPATVATLSNLASLHRREKNFAEAESLYVVVLNLDKEIFGDQHHYIAADLNNIASINHITGNLIKSDSLFNKAIFMMREVLPESHPDLTKTLINHAKLLIDRDKLNRASVKLDEAIAKLSDNENRDPKDLIDAYAQLGTCYIKQEKFTEAENVLKEASLKLDSLRLENKEMKNLISATLDTLKAKRNQ